MTAHPIPLAGSTGRHWLTPAAEMAGLASGNWPRSPDPAPMGWACLPRIATCTPGVHAGSVRVARDFTIAVLQRWGVTERSDDITIVVSELVTNALQHGLPASGPAHPAGRVRFGLLQPGPCVVCAVADPSRAAPVMKAAGVLAETGRGLHVVDALADAWGCITPGDAGKTVWAMFSAGPRPVSGLPGARRGR
jgi:hypothetical protein